MDARFRIASVGVFGVFLAGMVPASLSADSPISAGDRACLFLDDRFIAEQSGLKRTWHQGQPRPEVAIQAEKEDPTDLWPHMYGSVLYDPQVKVYRMYYESVVWPSHSPGVSFTCHTRYAESKDGKSWIKPMLDLYEDLGSKKNNIVIPESEYAKVFIDPLEKDPAARFKMFVYLHAIKTTPETSALYPAGAKSADGAQIYPIGGSGECLLSSGDGIHWRFIAGFNSPPWADEEHAPLRNFTDSRSFLFDPLAQRYMAYIRTFAKSHVAESKENMKRRAIGISHSARINRDWSPVVHVIEPDARDDEKVAPLSKDPTKPDYAEHYSLSFFNYGNHYIGMLSLLYLIDDYDGNGGGDLQLMYSHDGYKWFRQPDRQTMVAPSNAEPKLFPNYVSNNGPLEIGEELWLYYTEANCAHPMDPKVGVAKSQIRAAVWRKDGFVSLDAAGKGSLTTQLLTFTGKQLRVNFEGSVTVALLDERGGRLKGFKPQTLKGNFVSQPVNWDLSSFAGQPIRLRFDLDHAKLWSFRFAP